MDRRTPGQQALDASVGRKIAARRLELGISKEELAPQLGLSVEELTAVEEGEARLSAPGVYDAATVLKVLPGTLLQLDG